MGAAFGRPGRLLAGVVLSGELASLAVGFMILVRVERTVRGSNIFSSPCPLRAGRNEPRKAAALGRARDWTSTVAATVDVHCVGIGDADSADAQLLVLELSVGRRVDILCCASFHWYGRWWLGLRCLRFVASPTRSELVWSALGVGLAEGLGTSVHQSAVLHEWFMLAGVPQVAGITAVALTGHAVFPSMYASLLTARHAAL